VAVDTFDATLKRLPQMGNASRLVAPNYKSLESTERSWTV